MTITMVAAMAHDNALGKGNRLPWPRMAGDMKRFHDSIENKAVIMGRTSYDSLPIPLPWRFMVVLADGEYTPKYDRTVVASSLEEALRLATEDAKANSEDEVMIAGGASIYEQFLPNATRMLLTFIDGNFEADRFFPQWNKDEWKEVAREHFDADEKNPYPYAFVTLERN
ncbi:MAG: dihydrofolate reductase [Candidatus Spechtbacterales bacterium]